MKRFVAILVFAAALASAVFAADVSGTWRAEFTTPDGTQRVNTFVFKAEGEKLSGTVAGTQDETPIKDGKIAGDAISFTADRPFGSFTYKGKIGADSITFVVEFNDNKFEMTAKKVK